MDRTFLPEANVRRANAGPIEALVPTDRVWRPAPRRRWIRESGPQGSHANRFDLAAGAGPEFPSAIMRPHAARSLNTTKLPIAAIKGSVRCSTCFVRRGNSKTRS